MANAHHLNGRESVRPQYRPTVLLKMIFTFYSPYKEIKWLNFMKNSKSFNMGTPFDTTDVKACNQALTNFVEYVLINYNCDGTGNPLLDLKYG